MRDWDNLTEAVRNAARDFSTETKSFKWSSDGEDIEHWPESARDLVEAIKDMNALTPFQGRKSQWVHSQEYITTPIHLAEWLIRIANRHGPKGVEFAISSLRKYIDEDIVSFHQVRPLADVDFTENFHSFQFSNGVKFAFSGRVPNGNLAYELTRNQGLGMPKCQTVLFTSHSHPTHHIEIGFQGDLPSGCDLSKSAQLIEDTMHCLSLVTRVDRGVFGMSITCVPDEMTPCSETHREWSIMPIEAPTRSLFLSQDDLKAADDLIKRFDSIKPKKQKTLRIAMRHLNAFGARLPPVERAVHLRIALEAMFANDHDEKGQIRYRLSTRAAWCLGSDPKVRKEYRRSFRDAYDDTSKAVHEGELSGEKLAKLNEVAEQAQKVLRRFIEDGGYPTDWGLLELGG